MPKRTARKSPYKRRRRKVRGGVSISELANMNISQIIPELFDLLPTLFDLLPYVSGLLANPVVKTVASAVAPGIVGKLETLETQLSSIVSKLPQEGEGGNGIGEMDEGGNVGVGVGEGGNEMGAFKNELKGGRRYYKR